VLIKPGQTTTVGPIQLGAPDARLTVRSAPAGAAVTIAGEFRGRTPLDVELPPGARYDVLLSLMGYAPWIRTVAAEPGIRTALEARLEPVYVSLTLQGEPADAELLIDGQPRGAAAATHQVLAGQRRIEVRRAGMQTFANNVDLAAGLARVLEYRLVPEGRPADWKPPAAAAVTKVGQSLRLMPAGAFMMGSARREQGRRPDQALRSVTLSRPFYLGVREVTNAEFRRFRAEHSSGSTGQRSIDLDNHPVSMVTWNDAVEYCNWLSQQEGLPPAYEQKEGRWTLRVPVTTGYRLPTEAEWEFAARHAPNGLRRYEWGDALPPPAAAGNLAGQEAETTLEAWLRDYRDDYPVVAPVGKYPPNALGLQDMTGNVSEWVHDFYSSFGDAAASTDPLGPPSGTRHVVRGASWRTAAYADLRLAWREGAEAAGQDIGFRLARYAE
jgi:formylglycine-generating enzyme required for sulfatase activity